MKESDLAIVAALVFAWGTLSARLERFDVTAPIIFVLAGMLLTHGPLSVLSVTPAPELVKALAEVTLALDLRAPDAVGRRPDAGGCRCGVRGL